MAVRQPSQAVWRVVNEMVEAGLADATIAAVLLDARYKISENPLEKGRRARAFVAREIGKARKYQENKPPEERFTFSDDDYFSPNDSSRPTRRAEAGQHPKILV